MARIKNNNGFTLIELVISICIIGIIIVPLLGLFAESMKNNVYSKSRITTGAAAQSFMEYYKSGSTAKTIAEQNSLALGDTVSVYLLYKDGENLPLPTHKVKYLKNAPYNETYDNVLNRFGGTSYEFDFVIKVEIGVKDTNLLQISISAWDKLHKDKSRINIISLRSY